MSGFKEEDRILLTAGASGLASGLLEACLLLLIQAVPGWITWQMRLRNTTSEILWVAPLFNLLVFLLVGVLLRLAFKLTEKAPLLSRKIAGHQQTIALFLLTWMGIYAVLMTPDRIAAWAAVLLSAGLSYRLTRWLSSRVWWGGNALRKGSYILMGLVVTGFLVTSGMRFIRERIALSRLPSMPNSAPNILLVVLDTLRADHLSSYGYERLTTPYIDKLSEEGVLFARAYSTSPWTLPGHASLFTGYTVQQHCVTGQNPELSRVHLTLPEILQERGYATAGFSANTWWVTRNTGFDQGFIHFEDYYQTPLDVSWRTVYGREIILRIARWIGYRDIVGRQRADDVVRSFSGWLEDNPHRPFFAFLNLIDVHGPYLSPAPHHTKFMTSEQINQEGGYNFSPPEVFQGDQQARELAVAGYDGALAYADAELGQLFEEMEREGVLDRTLVIITSDHGESFGDHGFYQHGHSLYWDQLHVPLILRHPELIPQGIRVDTPVSLRDLPATVLTLATPEMGVPLEGSPLFTPGGEHAIIHQDWQDLPVASVTPSAREVIPPEWPISEGWLQALITSDWYYILQESGNWELFDSTSDREQLRDLSLREGSAGMGQELRNLLQSILINRSLPTSSCFPLGVDQMQVGE